MATVYSLVCWGGLTGKVVSISASTDVVTLTNHGLRNGAKLWPSGTLPSELNTSTPVYARSTGTNTFTLHTSAAGAIANTGQILFAGSSTYAAVTLKSDLVADPSNALSAYGLSDLSRWGSSGSERIYDGIASWNSARSSASAVDVEVCEIGESFTETTASGVTVSVPCAATRIESKINGVRSPGFHYGGIYSGYTLYSSSSGTYTVFSLNKDNTTIDGFTLQVPSGYYGNTGILLNAFGQKCRQMISIGPGGYTSIGSYGNGISQVVSGVEISQCLSFGWLNGIKVSSYMAGMLVADNFVTKCGTGILASSSTNISGSFYGNISVGNTTNWYSATGQTNATQNFGLSGEAWVVGSGTRGTIATSDFANYASGDFRPATATSPQVDTGVDYYGAALLDIGDSVRPSYKGGLTTYRDAGPYEFDHGYGPWPATHTLTLTNVVVGSRVHIRDQADTVTHHDDIASASSVVIPITVYGDSRDNWRIKVRKASAAPYYQPWETIMTATAGTSSIYVSQIPD